MRWSICIAEAPRSPSPSFFSLTWYIEKDEIQNCYAHARTTFQILKDERKGIYFVWPYNLNSYKEKSVYQNSQRTRFNLANISSQSGPFLKRFGSGLVLEMPSVFAWTQKGLKVPPAVSCSIERRVNCNHRWLRHVPKMSQNVKY